MNEYEVIISRKVIKTIEKLEKPYIYKIHEKISSLAKNPRPVGCKKLKGFTNFWRVRIGSYRIIYSIQDQIKIVKIRKVSKRNDAY